MSRFVPLHSVAKVGLGFKSLQNDFYYLNSATIANFGIEEDYLEPITTLRELNAGSYYQRAAKKTWIFTCNAKLSDLRGTGALRYINTMGNRPAAQRKQSAKAATIRQVLEAQSGSLWYAPKAQTHPAHVWIRKAVSSVYAPFLFKKASVVDQRCNYVEPKDVSWQLLASLVTSSLFSLATEVNGSSSMGAGALEVATSKLRDYPIANPSALDARQRKQLCSLAEGVWSSEAPVDWEKHDEPSQNLQELDGYLLSAIGSSVPVDQVYKGIRETCRARLLIAKDKAGTTKKQKSENISSLAKTIAAPLGRLLQSRQFPEQFGLSGPTMLVHIQQDQIRAIYLESFFGATSVTVEALDGSVLYRGQHPESVADVVVRGLLLGRESFSVPTEVNIARQVNTAFDLWFDKIKDRLEKAVSESAIGTGYDSLLYAEVYRILNINPVIAYPALPQEIAIR